MITEIIATIPASAASYLFYTIREGKHIMGEIRINLSNSITIGLVAFVSVWLINRGLTKMNKSQWKA